MQIYFWSSGHQVRIVMEKSNQLKARKSNASQSEYRWTFAQVFLVS